MLGLVKLPVLDGKTNEISWTMHHRRGMSLKFISSKRIGL